LSISIGYSQQRLNAHSDVLIRNPLIGQVLLYDATLGRWINDSLSNYYSSDIVDSLLNLKCDAPCGGLFDCDSVMKCIGSSQDFCSYVQFCINWDTLGVYLTFLDTIHWSIEAQYALTADSASYAINAFHADTAGFAYNFSCDSILKCIDYPDSILYAIHADTAQYAVYAVYADSAGKPDSAMIAGWNFVNSIDTVDSQQISDWGFCCTDSQQIVDWGFGSASLDTLGAYYDTTQIDSILGGYLDTTASFYSKLEIDSFLTAKCDTPCAGVGGVDSIQVIAGTTKTTSGYYKTGGSALYIDTTTGVGGAGISVKDTTLNLKIADFVGSASYQYYSIAVDADYIFLSDFWAWCDTNTATAYFSISKFKICADSFAFNTGKNPIGYTNLVDNPFQYLARTQLIKTAPVGSSFFVVANAGGIVSTGGFIFFDSPDADSFYYESSWTNKTWDTLYLSSPLISEKDSGSFVYGTYNPAYKTGSAAQSPQVSLYLTNHKIYFGIIGGTALAHYYNVNIRMRARIFR